MVLRLDIVIPVYNEEQAAPVFHQQLVSILDTLPYDCQIFYINDGSSDQTQVVLEKFAANDPRVCIIEFSRNFGHQAALTAGLDLAVGDIVITMDGDGQHPPEMIPEMLKLAENGYEIVLTQRKDQQTSTFKKQTSSVFYRLINQIGDTKVIPGSADFRLMTRPVVKALREMREYHRFLRGMVSWVGYKVIILPYDQPDRVAGKSKYSLKKMVRLATDAVFSFSLLPLYIGISVGAIFLVLAVLEALYVLSFWVTGRQAMLVPGWSSLMFMLLIVGGSLMVTIGFIGIYVGYIFQEVKGRPIYIVRSRTGSFPDLREEDHSEAFHEKVGG